MLKQKSAEANKVSSNQSRDELAKIAGGDKKSKTAKSVVQKSAPAIRNKSRDELAKIAGVSHDTIEKVECIKKKGVFLNM